MNQINKLNTATNTHTSNHQKNTLSFLVVSLLSLTTLISTSNLVYADTTVSSSASANASITVAPTIRVTLTGGDLVIDNLIPGSSSDSNIITAAVTTNAAYGYNLLATTGTSATNTNLTHSSNSSFYFTSLSSNKATLNDFSDNTWGYSYSKDNGTTWISGSDGATMSGYNGLPKDNDDNGATGITLISTDTYSATNAIQFKIGAKASTTQASGTYNGVVNFYAVTNPELDNTMQGFAAGNASTTCSAMSTGDTLTLTDSRDNQEYTIGKLADNNCWLLDNLALDLTDSTVLNGMTEDNTNASNTTLGYLKNGGGTTSDQYATAAVSNWTSSYSYSAPRVNLTNKDVVPTDATSTAGGYKVGGYYNYCAASAGSYCYGNGTSYGTSSGNATEDICPKGWRMPTGNTAGEYSALANAIYGSTDSTSDAAAYANYRAVLRLPLSGRFENGSTRAQGYGFFWSSTRASNSYMYYLELDTSDVSPRNSDFRYYGISIRCILSS